MGAIRAASPTTQQWDAYQSLYEALNREFFDGELPSCVLNFSRHNGALGFFVPDAWTAEGNRMAHEISINPDHLSRREIRQTVSTLLHEMVHLWQQVFGKPARRGYHNKQWANAMERVGLTPSHTGEPGGKRVGQKMTHYITPGGRFAVFFKTLSRETLLPWRGSVPAAVEKKKKAKNKLRYTCPKCGLNVWGKPGLTVACVEDDETLAMIDDDDEG